MWINDWTTRAACKGTDPDELFVQGAAQNRAKLICRGCPVRTECLADALDNGIEFGVWGGMTERERRALLRRRPDVTSWRELLERARDEYERQSLDELVASADPRGQPIYSDLPPPPTPAVFANGTPAWSPDGRRLAVAGQPGGGLISVWIVEPDGPTVYRKLIDLPTGSRVRGLSWTRDGSALIIGKRDTSSDIVMLDSVK